MFASPLGPSATRRSGGCAAGHDWLAVAVVAVEWVAGGGVAAVVVVAADSDVVAVGFVVGADGASRTRLADAIAAAAAAVAGAPADCGPELVLAAFALTFAFASGVRVATRPPVPPRPPARPPDAAAGGGGGDSTGWLATACLGLYLCSSIVLLICFLSSFYLLVAATLVSRSNFNQPTCR